MFMSETPKGHTVPAKVGDGLLLTLFLTPSSSTMEQRPVQETAKPVLRSQEWLEEEQKSVDATTTTIVKNLMISSLSLFQNLKNYTYEGSTVSNRDIML